MDASPPSTPDLIPTRLFSTDVVPPPQRHEFWQSQGWPSVGQVYEYHADPGFIAHSKSISLDSLTMSVGHYGAQVVERDPTLIRRAPVDNLLVSIPLNAPMTTDVGNVMPGGAVILDLARPWRHRSEQGAMAVIGLPRAVALEHGIDPQTVHGAIVPFEETTLLREHTLRIVEKSNDIPVAAASRLSRTVVDLLAVTLIDKTSLAPPPELAMDEIYKQRACRLILTSLTQPWLNAEYLAAMLNMSRSSLYRLFASEGGVQRYIRHERLTAASVALTGSTATIGEIAARFQFTDTAHFARAFRAVFGMTPRELRVADRDTLMASARSKIVHES